MLFRNKNMIPRLWPLLLILLPVGFLRSQTLNENDLAVVVIQKDSLIIRSGPGINFSVVGKAARGDTIQVLKMLTRKERNESWGPIEYSGNYLQDAIVHWFQVKSKNKITGYAHRMFIRAVKPDEQKIWPANPSVEKVFLDFNTGAWYETLYLLKKINGNYLIDSSEIRIEQYAYEADDPGYLPSYVKHSNDGSIRFYLKGFKNIVPGPIETIIDGWRKIDSPVQMQLSNGRNYNLYIDCKEIGVPQDKNQKWVQSPLVLVCGSKKQVLDTYEMGKTAENKYLFYYNGYPIIRWAGDIDRDGKLDFLVNLSSNDHVSGLTFFMSSLAQEVELVHRVYEEYHSSE